MPDRTKEFGLYGAHGEKGSQAAARVLDRLALEGGIASPVTSRRGLRARLRYLDSGPGRRAIQAAGITVTPRTLKRWMAGEQRPNAANLTRIDAAYTAHRRRNVARHLLQRLNARGGTRVEIHPLDQSAVAGLAAGEERLLAEAVGGQQTRYPDVTVEHSVVRGGAREALIEASRDAGLIVVGARGRGGFTGLLLGSVSQALLHHAHCPVLVVGGSDA